MKIHTPRLNLYNRSWTFEAWIYPTNIPGSGQNAIVAQCDINTVDTCLHILIRDQKLSYSQVTNDANGVTNLKASRWYHVGFTVDCHALNISIYLDGVLDGSGRLTRCFQGFNSSLTVGVLPWGSHFDGLIDEFSYTNRTKTAEEILRDATLVAHFSFDENSTYDQGPLRISSSLVGNTTFVAGRVGQALEIQNITQSYLKVQALVLLGTSNRSYSFSIWIRPKLQQKSVIIHASPSSDGSGWSFPLLQMTASYQLRSFSSNGTGIWVTGPAVPSNSWTHAAVTYSLSNGLRLYVNGTLSNASVPFLYSPPGMPLYLFVGSDVASAGWGTASNSSDQYYGAVDELRVYAREIPVDEIAGLAHPGP